MRALKQLLGEGDSCEVSADSHRRGEWEHPLQYANNSGHYSSQTLIYFSPNNILAIKETSQNTKNY